MGGRLSLQFQNVLDYLNTGCDDTTNSYIDNMYFKLTTLSAIHPALNREKPLLSLISLLLLLFNSVVLINAWMIAFVSTIALSKISFVLSMNEAHVTILLQMSLAVSWHSWTKRPNTASIHRIISHNFFDYQEDLSETWQFLRNAMLKDKGRCLRSVVLIGFATAATVLSQRWLNKLGAFQYSNIDLHGVNFDLPLPAAYPYNASDTFGFAFNYSFQILSSSVFCLVLSAKCLMCIESNLYIQMHLKLLIFQFENIENRAINMYKGLYGIQPQLIGSRLYKDEGFCKCYNICLRKNIKHHQIIIRAKNELNNIFGFYVFNYYVTCTAAIAISVLSASSARDFPGTAFASTIMCMVETFFVALYAHMGQKLTDLGTDLKDEIYKIKWYYVDEGTKKIMKIIQIVAAEPFIFSYHTIVRINHDSFATVMNSAYTYYNLVNAYS